MKKNLMVASSVVLGFAPFVALAQSTAQGCSSDNLFGILCTVAKFMQQIIPVLILLGVIWFVWGVVSFVIANDEEAKTKGKDRMIYGIIGLAVIVAMWGLVNILVNTFGISTETQTTFPTVVIPEQ